MTTRTPITTHAFLTAVIDGELDDRLDFLQREIDRRNGKEVPPLPSAEDFKDGQKVVINKLAEPFYLRGLHARVIGKGRKLVAIEVEDTDKEAARRFGTGPAKVPAWILEPARRGGRRPAPEPVKEEAAHPTAA